MRFPLLTYRFALTHSLAKNQLKHQQLFAETSCNLLITNVDLCFLAKPCLFLLRSCSLVLTRKLTSDANSALAWTTSLSTESTTTGCRSQVLTHSPEAVSPFQSSA